MKKSSRRYTQPSRPFTPPALKPNPLNARPPPCDRQRRSELARLLPLWPKELEDLSLEGRRHIIRALARALRCERTRGRGGHWAYDLARHAALLRCYRDERAALVNLEKGPLEGGPNFKKRV